MEELTKEIIKGLFTAASAFAGGLYALRRYRMERLWDHKKRAYDDVVDAMEICIAHYRLEKWQLFLEDMNESCTSQQIEAYRISTSKYESALATLRRIETLGIYVVSARSSEVLTQCLREIRQIGREFSGYAQAIEEEAAFKMALIEFVMYAKHDLDFMSKATFCLNKLWLMVCYGWEEKDGRPVPKKRK